MALAKNSKVKRAREEPKWHFSALLSTFLVAPGGDDSETPLLGIFCQDFPIEKTKQRDINWNLRVSIPTCRSGGSRQKQIQTSKCTCWAEGVTSPDHPWQPWRTERRVRAHLLQELSVSLCGLLDELPHRPPFLAGHHHACLPKRHRHLHYGVIHFIQNAGPVRRLKKTLLGCRRVPKQRDDTRRVL